MATLLIIDDEKSIRKTLTEILSFEGYKIDEAVDGEEGWNKFKQNNYDVVLCDIKMPKMDGLEFLGKAASHNPDTPIIMISGHGTIETAVEAVKKGAYDFIQKPPDLNRLLITIRNAKERNTLVAEAKTLKRRVSRVQEMVGDSACIIKIKENIYKITINDSNLLKTKAVITSMSRYALSMTLMRHSIIYIIYWSHIYPTYHQQLTWSTK